MNILSFVSLYNLFILFSSRFILNSLSAYIDATTYIGPYRQFCLTEMVGKDMFVHITFHFFDLLENEAFSAYIIEEGASKYIYNEGTIKNEVSVSFTSIEGPSVIFCVRAPHSGGHLNFSIKFGADARDYSIIAKSTHLDPVDARIQNVLDELSSFHKAQLIGASFIDKTSEKAIQTYHLLARFAIANSVFMIFSTMCYIFYFRHFFRSKKLI